MTMNDFDRSAINLIGSGRAKILGLEGQKSPAKLVAQIPPYLWFRKAW